MKHKDLQDKFWIRGKNGKIDPKGRITKNAEYFEDNRPLKRKRDWDYSGGGLSWSMIRKWLKSKVGEPWDFVYSQLCDQVSDKFKRDKFKDALNYIINKPDKNNQVDQLEPGDLYIDTKGILKIKTGVRLKWRYARPPSPIREINGKYYLKINNVWYELTEKYPSYTTGNDLEKHIRLLWNISPFAKLKLKEAHPSTIMEGLGRLYSKRQLNSKEIKRLNLNQD